MKELQDLDSGSTFANPMTTNDQTWLTLSEAATHIRVSKRTIENWIAEGRINSYKLVEGRTGSRRVKRSELDAWVEGRVEK